MKVCVAFVKMGSRTVARLFPEKKVIRKTKDETEGYWADSEHPGGSSEITTPELSESPRFRNKKLRQGTGVKALSGKQRRLLDDETENYNDYLNEFESVTDSAYRTRPSDLTDASNRTLPSGFIDAANRKRSSSLKPNFPTLGESSGSYEPEKRVHSKFFNTSKTVEDNLTPPSHRAAYKSSSLTIPSTRATSLKKNILVASRSLRNNSKYDKECVSKVYLDNMVQDEIASIRPRGKNKSCRIFKDLGTSLSGFSNTKLVNYSSSEEEFDIVVKQKLGLASPGRQSITDNSKNQAQDITKSTSPGRSPRNTELATDVKSDTDYKFDDNHSDKVSLITEKTSMASSASQRLSSKNHSKNKKLDIFNSSTAKRKINVAVNTENNTEYLKQQEFATQNLDPEINSPSIMKPNYNANYSHSEDNSQQRSLRSKIIESDSVNELHSNAAPEVSLARNKTAGATVNTHQYFPSKRVSKYRKLYSSNSLTTKRKNHASKYTERDLDNFEEVSEERDLEPLRGKGTKKKQGNTLIEVPSDQLRRSKSDGNAVMEVPSDQLRRSKRDGNALVKVPSIQLRRSKRNGNAVVEVPSVQLRRSKRDRIAPLKYWANERRLFSHNFRTGEIKCLGIDPGTGEDDECQRYLKRMEEKRQQAKMKKKTTKNVSKTAVFNKRRGKNEHVVLHMPFDSITWKPPFSTADNNAIAGYYLSKPFNSSKLMSGFLKIRPREVKPRHISPVGSIYFLVAKGQVKVTISDTVYELKRMDSFIVPKHQSYSIENLLNSYALLSFCAFKAPFFDYELK